MDIRGAVAEMPPAEELPAFAQVWALGFMFAVEYWPDEWAAPKDKDAAKWLNDALEAVVAMTEDDTLAPEVSPLSEDDTPTGKSLGRSRQTGISDHDKPERAVTIGRNDQSR